MNQLKSIFISGAGGFLGQELLRQLITVDQYNLYILTSQPNKIKKQFSSSQRLTIINRSDYKDFDYSQIDILINCAFPRSAGSVELAHGLDFLYDFLSTAASGGVGSIINISSQSVYSQKKAAGVSAYEQDQPELENMYALGKYAIEQLFASFITSIPCTNIRLSSLIGAGFDQRLTNKFVKQVIAGAPLNISGGNQLFNFLDVKDAAEAIRYMLNSNPQNWENIYNLGNQENVNLIQIAETVCCVARNYLSIPVEMNVTSSDYWNNSSINADLFYKTFNWKPKYSLKDTIEDIFIYQMSLNNSI